MKTKRDTGANITVILSTVEPVTETPKGNKKIVRYSGGSI